MSAILRGGTIEGAKKPMDEKELFQAARKAQDSGQLGQAAEKYSALIEAYPDSEEAKIASDLASNIKRQTTELSGVNALLLMVFGLGFWGLVGLGITAIWHQPSRDLLSNRWFWIAIGFIFILALIIKAIESRLSRVSAAVRRATIAFAAIPFIILVLTAVVFLTAEYQAFALELVLIMVACIIPGAAYYLFLATRRPSILNEFLVNLTRLGLLHKGVYESREERRARLHSYFQRFEAIYGVLRFDLVSGREVSRSEFVDLLIDAIDQSTSEERSRRNLHTPQATVRFTDIFRANLIIPLGLVTVLTAIGWVLVMQPEWIPLGTGRAEPMSNIGVQLTPNWTPVNFAFLGAYFFGIQMLFRRFVRRDLGPNAYLAFANRIILSVIAVWVTMVCYVFLADGATGTVDLLMRSTADSSKPWPELLLAIAFVVGVFPRMLWQFIATLFAKITFAKLVIQSIESKQPLSELDGLTVWHESRLEEEDVENVPNMATVDLVDIMLHTQIPAERLIAWVDQAILYSALGPEGAGTMESNPRHKLRALGLRNATHVVAAFDAEKRERTALEAALRTDDEASIASTLVGALRLESNFDLVYAWRQAGAARAVPPKPRESQAGFADG